MDVSGTRIGFLILLSIVSKREIRHSDPLFLFYFFNVLGVINNCAKFQQVLITTSFSMESP